MTLAVTFLIVFLVGPWAFRRLTQPVPSPRVMRAVALLALSAFLMALALRIGFASHWGDSLWLSAATAAALWAAWIAVIALGFILMSGGGSEDPNEFNDAIYNFQRIRLAPTLVLIGFAIEVYAILLNPNKK